MENQAIAPSSPFFFFFFFLSFSRVIPGSCLVNRRTSHMTTYGEPNANEQNPLFPLISIGLLL